MADVSSLLPSARLGTPRLPAQDQIRDLQNAEGRLKTMKAWADHVRFLFVQMSFHFCDAKLES